MRNFDTLGQEISKKIEKTEKRNHIIDLLRERYYDTVNTLAFVEILEKGKIPTTMHKYSLYAIAKDLKIEDLDRFFEFDNKDKIINEKNEEIAFLRKEIGRLTRKRK